MRTEPDNPLPFRESLEYFQKAAQDVQENHKASRRKNSIEGGEWSEETNVTDMREPQVWAAESNEPRAVNAPSSTRAVGRWKERSGGTQCEVLTLPKRRPQLNLLEVEADICDLSEFKERIGILPSRSLSRVQSLNEGLDRVPSPYLNRTQSYSTGLEKTGVAGDGRLERVPSVVEILTSVKSLRHKDMGIADTKKSRGKIKNKAPRPPIASIFNKQQDLEHCYENLNSSSHYENLNEGALYDEPRKIDLQLYETIRPSTSETHYENINGNEPTYMNVAGDMYENVGKSSQYDVPRSATHIYDFPQKTPRKKEVPPSEYDVPRVPPHQCLVPQASKMLLERQRDEPVEECEQDSLDGEDRPNIPSPDYGSDEEQVDYVDEGLEADALSYYNDDQGLEVILEEPELEDSYITSIGASLEGEPSSEEESASSGIHSDPGVKADTLKKEAGEERDRVVEVYPETVRQRKSPSKNNDKMDITSLGSPDKSKDKKFLPSVRALRTQFESKPELIVNMKNPTRKCTENAETEVQPIYKQFGEIDESLMKPKLTTLTWDPTHLLKDALYTIPEPVAMNVENQPKFINMEGWLEKLPSGRKKATFWNAWKRRYFRLKDGHLTYSTNSQTDKPKHTVTLQLLGGNIDTMDSTMLGIDDKAVVETMIGIDDGKGHYIAVRCGSKDATERWKKALMSHTVDDYKSAYTQPWPHPREPHMLRDTIIIDLGSHSVRAGVLATQPTLPKVFFPAVMAINKTSNDSEYGFDALLPGVRQKSTLHWPFRPTSKINKFSVDFSAVTGLLKKAFYELNVDPKKYNILLVAARSFDTATLAKFTSLLIDGFNVTAVSMAPQAILTLWAYNTSTGVAVDIGERIDVVPITDGYIVKGGLSRVPYGGARIVDHLRHFFLQKHTSMVTEVESYLIHYALENLCYCSTNYSNELANFRLNPKEFQKSLPVGEFLQKEAPWDELVLDSGRFQATEGLFTPSAWGLDNLGIHKLVHKAIQECGVDVRRALSRSIFLSGGVTMLPGFSERIQSELTHLMPTLSPVVHASPFRYHAAFLGACQLAVSLGFNQSKVTREEWSRKGDECVSKWKFL